MTRTQANLCLLLTAVIWGTAFVAQKTGMDGLGPLGFVGLRFVLSFLVVLPFVILETKRAGFKIAHVFSDIGVHRRDLIILWASFFIGCSFQQMGIAATTVTNAGFLTGVYVVMVPFVGWVLFRHHVRRIVWLACFVTLAGVWLLNGADISRMGAGDWQVLAGALCFGVHVVMLGRLAQATGRPIMVVCSQYAVAAVFGLGLAAVLEGLDTGAIAHNIWPVLYAGVISGGIAYTLQAVGQKYTHAADAGVILSAEALFAALAGAVMLGERMDMTGWAGCALILCAMLMVEYIAALHDRRAKQTEC